MDIVGFLTTLSVLAAIWAPIALLGVLTVRDGFDSRPRDTNDWGPDSRMPRSWF